MTAAPTQRRISLTERTPRSDAQAIIAGLTPPPQFAQASFENYRPDADYPSQAEAVTILTEFADAWGVQRSGGFFGRKKKAPTVQPGIYLDGGFGVGKTHLLASLWHRAPGPRKYFGTFIEYTSLVGALGYQQAVQALTGATLICIDEFELDDPGDTMLMTRLLGELVASGTRIAATSNTPPGALGEGRFAAADFLREIQAMSAHFRTLRIDGTDYRRRAVSGSCIVTDPANFDTALTAGLPVDAEVSDDTFDALLNHLQTVHPSRYAGLITGLSRLGIRDVHELTDQTRALQIVAFIDRVYDAQVPIVASGIALDQIFGDGMLEGGYRKKYQRAISRMIALTHAATPAE
ncbi:cell division protein ZapE [Mycetocola lacteus]|uniref:Cell division protein ZapE n=1 Tax=Mycetocola lacteus TaxID=76637 RepID=A0A3L7AP18_9MICO|nr:cell division protein ZapE [Mycetocola lacteus]RLP82097.1 cell division protein ZapE [Mycetocola lacteus]